MEYLIKNIKVLNKILIYFWEVVRMYFIFFKENVYLKI